MAAALAPLPAAAQADHPDKPLRISVAYPTGGFNDTLGHILAAKLKDSRGQPVVVENKPGAGTIIGTGAVAKSAPDGYTMVILSFPFAVNPALRKKLPYDSDKDLAPLVANVMVVPSNSPFKSQGDLKAAKAKPGSIRYASSGSGASQLLAMEMLKSMANIARRRLRQPVDVDAAHQGGQTACARDQSAKKGSAGRRHGQCRLSAQYRGTPASRRGSQHPCAPCGAGSRRRLLI